MNMKDRPLVVKIGGQAALDNFQLDALLGDVRHLINDGWRILIVHGGGNTISTLQKRYEVEPNFVDGIRQTPPEEMELVDMALIGGVNTRLVRRFQLGGINAWGLSGADAGTLKAASIADSPNLNRTGRVVAVDRRPFDLLWSAGYTPIFAPPASDDKHRGINVNADVAALALSSALQAGRLIFVSDIPGVLKENQVIPHLTPSDVERNIQNEVITQGMIPKVRAAVGALNSGTAAVIIGQCGNSGDLLKLLSGSQGTCLSSMKEKSHDN